MSEIKELRKELKRMDEYTLALGEKLNNALARIVELENRGKPAVEPVETEDGHIIVEQSSAKSRARKSNLAAVGRHVNPGEVMVGTCDEIDCVRAEHVEIMTKGESRIFNSKRVAEELSRQDKSKIAFMIDAMGTHLNDGHFIPADEMFTLPSGRRISTAKAVIWANGESAEVPFATKKNCGNPDCALPDHIEPA